MGIVREYPYVAMINQRFHRIYVDCEELIKFILQDMQDRGERPMVPPLCCTNCLGGQTSMLNAPVQKKIWAKPPAKDGVNVDWSLNIEAVVCCNHHHTAATLDRSDWIKFARKCGATPFFSDFEKNDGTWEFDDEGTPIRSRRPVPVATVSNPRRSPARKVGVPVNPTVPSFARKFPCQICGTPTPIHGNCPKCFG
jgi:hypothetical protein